MPEGTESREAELDEDQVAPNSVPRASIASANDACAEVHVIVATSDMMKTDPSLVNRITHLVNSAYGYSRLSQGDVRQRIAMGDAGDRANRVLHLSYSGRELQGCCSSTIQAPWTSQGCGHWGLLSVDPTAQGTGVASALVSAAERRLILSGCKAVQIEYEYTCGDEFSERLYKWYEGRLGFQCVSGRPRSSRGSSEFRKCLKSLPKKPAPQPVKIVPAPQQDVKYSGQEVVEDTAGPRAACDTNIYETKTKVASGCVRCAIQ